MSAILGQQQQQQQQPTLSAVLSALDSGDLDSACGFLTALDRETDVVLRMLEEIQLIPKILDKMVSIRHAKIPGFVLDIMLKMYKKSPNTVVEGLLTATPPVSTGLMCLVRHEEDLSISDQASQLLTELVVNSRYELAEPVLRDLCAEADKWLASSMTLYLRYASIIARILSRGDPFFTSCCNFGATSKIVDICQHSEDILVQINFLELLVEFAKSDVSLQYLVQSGVIEWLVETASSDAFAASRAFGVIGELLMTSSLHSLQSSQQLVDRLIASPFMDTLQTFVSSRADADRATGLSVLASFAGSSEAALTVVMGNEELLRGWMGQLNSGKSEVVAAVLLTMAQVLEGNSFAANAPPQSSSSSAGAAEMKAATDDGPGMAGEEAGKSRGESSATMTALKKKLVALLGKVKQTPPVAFLVKTARQPIPDSRMASFALMTTLGRQQPAGWGLLELMGTPGFREFIVDRSTEFTKEGKDAKFAFISTIANSPQFHQFFDEHTCATVERLVAQGPYFVPALVVEPQVMEM